MQTERERNWEREKEAQRGGWGSLNCVRSLIYEACTAIVLNNKTNRVLSGPTTTTTMTTTTTVTTTIIIATATEWKTRSGLWIKCVNTVKVYKWPRQTVEATLPLFLLLQLICILQLPPRRLPPLFCLAATVARVASVAFSSCRCSVDAATAD